MRALIGGLALFALAWSSSPSRAEDELQAELAGLLERSYAAQRAGDLDGMMALVSREFRGMMSGAFSSDEEKQAFIERQKKAAPDSFEVLYFDPGGAFGTGMLAVAHGRRPPATPGGEWTEGDIELQVLFMDENGWKVAMIVLGPDPAMIERSGDASYEPIEAYDTETEGGLVGRIVRTEFKENHTLIVVRLDDEEDFVYLPSRQELIDGGFRSRSAGALHHCRGPRSPAPQRQVQDLGNRTQCCRIAQVQQTHSGLGNSERSQAVNAFQP